MPAHRYIIHTVDVPRVRGYWSEKDQIGFGPSLFSARWGVEVGAGGELGGDQGVFEGPQDRTGTQGSDIHCTQQWSVCGNFLKKNSSVACRPGLLKRASRVDFLGGGMLEPLGGCVPGRWGWGRQLLLTATLCTLLRVIIFLLHSSWNEERWKLLPTLFFF